MNVVINRIEETDFSYHDVVILMHEAFKERLEQGLRYTCSFITEAQFRVKSFGGIVFVAIDKGCGELVGTMTLNYPQTRSDKYGYMEYVAVRNDAKMLGIGSKMFDCLQKNAVENGCKYLLSDTSTSANSAVKWHLKLGFKIIGFESYHSTNYWSYVFRKQLVPSKKWTSNVYCRFRYILSWIFIRSTRDSNGNDNVLGRFLKAIIRKCKN